MSTDRLDRIEALLATVAEFNAASTQRLDRIEAGLDRTEKIVDSNARAIEAWSSRIEEGIAEAEEVSSSMSANTNQRMEQAIADTVQMIANLSQQQQETDQRFNNLLEEARADRQRAEQRDREWQQRFDQAQAANATEHRAFTQNVQVLLAEIARLWQRVAG